MANYALATRIARELFKLGDSPNSPCQRIQFMCGTYPDKEEPCGGLCENAAISFIAKAIDAAQPQDDVRLEIDAALARAITGEAK